MRYVFIIFLFVCAKKCFRNSWPVTYRGSSIHFHLYSLPGIDNPPILSVQHPYMVITNITFCEEEQIVWNLLEILLESWVPLLGNRGLAEDCPRMEDERELTKREQF